MLNQDLYPAMFVRKSVRSYSEQPLSAEQLTAVKAEIAKVQPLLPGERFQLELGAAKEGWRIYGFCEDTPLSNANLGYVIQQLDLALHVQGYGRLWFGMGRAPKELKAPQGLSYAMCLKVGNPAESIARESAGASGSASEFDRKAIGDVIKDAALQETFEAVRLAPSAMNSQPWRFTCAEGRFDAFCAKPGLKKIIIGRMNQIDMGIGLCHAVLALEREGKNIAPKVLGDIEAPAGYYYLLSLLDGR